MHLYWKPFSVFLWAMLALHCGHIIGKPLDHLSSYLVYLLFTKRLGHDFNLTLVPIFLAENNTLGFGKIGFLPSLANIFQWIREGAICKARSKHDAGLGF